MSIQKPLHIKQKHFDEWVVGSGVSELITSLNVRSLDDPREIDELLNRNTNQRWSHWEHGSGWAVLGIDAKGWEKTYEGAQFKPDNLVQRFENGKPKFKRDGSPDYQKYFSASDCQTAPLFLDTGIADYWPGILNDGTRRLLIAEGAKKAGAALTAGEACISLPGVTNGQRKGRLKKDIQQFCLVGRTIVLAFDSDQFHNPNVCKALDKLGRLIAACGSVVRVLELPRQTKGLDDFVVAFGVEAFKQLIDNALTFEEWRDRYILNPVKEVRTTIIEAPDAEENYQLKAQAALFSDRPWISIDGQLYEWQDSHYKVQSEATIKRRISDWCRVTAVYGSDGWRHSYATATHIDNIYAWVVRCFAVDPASINPPGLNCLNGTLQIRWQGNKPDWQMVPHDPAIPYTYVGEFEYNPNADPEACDRLLACLDPSHRNIFLQTLTASLDLKTIRRFRGRGIRALLCKGDGNNGKDSLREAVALLYGVGVVGTTVSDFMAYDQGRKFTLAKLEHARISWSSENSSISQLDGLQSLKAAITGETLDLERKNQDERPFDPCTVFFFNINNVPNLQASLEAIQSRWAILSFNKTFKTNADPSKGEIEADPRFRYDPNFLRCEVVPALLNKMLELLPEVAAKPIDYSCTEEALKDIQQETNHLWAFSREIGLDYQVGGRVYINDLWEKLKDWYLANGTLMLTTDAKGREKLEWHDQPRRGDKNVKAPNQVYQRFSELFPKVRKLIDTSRGDRTGQAYLQDIKIVEASLKTGVNADVELDEAISPTLAYALEVIEKLSPAERQLFVNKLVANNEYTQTASAASTSLPEGDTASTLPQHCLNICLNCLNICLSCLNIWLNITRK